MTKYSRDRLEKVNYYSIYSRILLLNSIQSFGITPFFYHVMIKIGVIPNSLNGALFDRTSKRHFIRPSFQTALYSTEIPNGALFDRTSKRHLIQRGFDTALYSNEVPTY